MKVYKTKKLFFGKWLYKIETHTPGANLIKSWGLSDATDFCNNKKDNRFQRHYSNVDKAQLLKYIDSIAPFFNKDIKTRAEWNTLNYFLNDLELFHELTNALKPWVVSITQPENEADIESLQSKSSLVLCDELPYGRYQYRLYLRSTMPEHHKAKFFEWSQYYLDKISISRGTTKWLKHENHYFQDPFIYVTDKNQLLMTSLHLGNWVRSTHEFVLRNTQNPVK